MGDLQNLILFLLFIPRTLREILLLTYWWQVKEYRLDRIWVFLKTREGREVFAPPLSLIKLFILLLSPLAFFTRGYMWVFVFLVALVFLLEDLIFAEELLKRKIRRPVFTLRANRIIFSTVTFVVFAFGLGYLFGFFLDSFLLGFLILLVCEVVPFATPLGIAWTQILVNRTKKKEVGQAKKHLQSVPNLISVGITGSYGKTSTKEFLATILGERFKVAKTTGSENTEFGIARKIMANVGEDTQVFIAEMGAYKKGEIAALARIVSPKIGVITGIEPQHLALFGNLENIKKAKFELIESFPGGGIAIFNLSDKYCRELYGRAKKLGSKLRVFGYFSSKGRKGDVSADLVSRIISASPKGVNFEISEKDRKIKFFAAVSGIHFIENLTAAILVARLLNMNWTDIKRGLVNVKVPEKTMRIHEKDYLTIIDDTYNTTPSGFKAALEFLSLFKKEEKIVVTPGIIELGDKSREIHKRLGGILEGVADTVILSSNEFERDIKLGMRSGSKKIKAETNPDRIYRDLMGRKGRVKAVVLLEGRVPSKLYESIITS